MSSSTGGSPLRDYLKMEEGGGGDVLEIARFKSNRASQPTCVSMLVMPLHVGLEI